ncbi:DUF5666 domain-containing protein [Sphaerotilus sp.]|jgi:Domain of unknown function (DUF5666)|uniref:DUF5666 domain-containing protein n=1 Tax=Sphaerotilus sp. TaxID=2093942 RepID=UPI0025CBBAD6|nr:DUF5666 domain-containing protein [Sphaerotilus sp.]
MRRTVMRRVGLAATVVGLVLAALVACGGGSVGTNGTGSPVMVGLSVGTVSGLGSVIVDGARHDDSAARTEISRNGTEAEVGDARLGHRVSLEFGTDTAGAQVLQRVELLPSVVGRVSERTLDTLGVLGQTVTVNSDPARGPITVFESPLNSVADVRLGDAVEVHAIAYRTGTGTNDVRLVATRIAPRSTLAVVRVSGTVAQLSAAASGGARSFRLGALTVQMPSAAAVLPSGTTLLDGHAVTVFAAESAFDAAALSLAATQVQVTALGQTSSGGVASTLRRAGLVGGWTGSAFELDGVALLVNADTQILSAGQPIANGAYVQATATLHSSGRWLATRIERLTSTSVPTELRGTLDDWSAASRTFTLRDTAVALTASTRVDLSGCGAAALVNGLYVEVQGSATAQGMTATSVACEAEPAGTKSRLERRGLVLSANAVTRTLTLRRQPGDPVLTVTWNDQTYLGEPLTSAALVALAGTARVIEVEGSLSLDGLQMAARKITLRASGS